MMQLFKPGFVQIAFGGGGDGGGGGGGDGGNFLSNLISSASRSGPTRADRPQQRPSIMTRGDEMVATRDMPRFGISAGDTATTPEYGSLSLRGLTSTEPGNVMRNIAGAEREARAEAARVARDGRGDDSPAPAQAAAAPAPAAAPAQAASAATELTSVADQEAQIEEAGETAAAKARRLGLASTIATSPGGLLAGGEDTTRRRRSLMGGGGLIA
jgi:hypothetical protein